MATTIASCTLGLVASLYVARRFWNGMLFNPLTGLFAPWLLALGLFTLNSRLALFDVGLTEPATLLLAVSFACYFIGGVLGIWLATRHDSGVYSYHIAEPRLTVLAILTVLYAVAFLVGVAWKYATVNATFGLPLEHIARLKPLIVSHSILIPLPSRFLTLFGYMAVLNVGVLLMYSQNHRWIGLAVALVLLSLVNDAVQGARGSTINTVILLICAAVFSAGARTGRIGLKHVLGAGAVFVVGLALITLIIYLRGNAIAGYLQRFVVDNYVYLVGTIPATSFFAIHPWPHVLPGQWTFAGLYQLLGMIPPLREPLAPLNSAVFPSFYAPVTSIGPFNSSAYVTYFDSDSGLAGVAVLSGLLGLAATYAFTKAVTVGRVVDLQIAALLMFLVLLTLRGTVTSSIMFWVVLGLIVVQWNFLVRTPRHGVPSVTRRGHCTRASFGLPGRQP